MQPHDEVTVTPSAVGASSLPHVSLARLARIAVITVCMVLLITVPRSASDAFLGYRVTDPPFTSLTYGIQAFLWWDNGSAGLHMDLIRLMGFSHVKQTFAWEDIEPVRGEWHLERGDVILDELERRSLKLVVRLSDAPDWAFPNNVPQTMDASLVVDTPPENLDDWANFCRTVAARYRGRVAAYQIWNEPNLSREWGGQLPDAAGYVALLRACSEAIRAVDPDAILISAGLAPTGNYDNFATPDDVYFQQMYDAGFQQYIDVVGVHAPGYTAPEVDPADAPGGNRFFSFRRVEDMRRIMVANGDAARQMAILELGWTTDQIHPDMAWFAVTEEEQARNLVAGYQYAAEHWRPWIGLMSMIYMANPAWTQADEQYWWSIITPDGYTRQAFIDLANMAKFCGDEVRPVRDPGSPEALGLVPVTP
ncbi:MAG TPA: hypothetical protein VK003_02520, partial [Oceanobacillus sp.]|nr:hypothetical protein [Oceanobacillus sp.]